MTSLAYQQETYTLEEYLAWERVAEAKSEYYDGRIVAMSGGSVRHSRIAANIIRALGDALDGTPCQPFTSDLRVWSGPNQVIYPDVTVVCQELELYDQHQDMIANPVVVIEVLSPTTEARDRGTKWMRLQMVKSLRHYLLIAQDEPHVDHFFRDTSQEWQHETVIDMNDAISLAGISCDLSMKDIYRRLFRSSEEASA